MEHPQTINALSLALKVDRRTLVKALAGVQPVRIQGRAKFYRTADARRVLAQRRRKAKAFGSLRREYMRLKNQKLKFEIAILSGEMVKRLDAAEDLTRLTTSTNSRLIRTLTTEWPAKLAGTDESTRRAAAEKLVAEIVAQFQCFEKRWTA